MERDDPLPTDDQPRSFPVGEQSGFNLLGRHGRNRIVWLIGLPIRVVRLWVFLRRLVRPQRDEVHPVSFRATPHSIELSELAVSLASRHHEAEEAVQLLREKAGRHRNDLRLAATRTRSRDWITEDRTTNRANELLLAALENRPVEPNSAEQEAWFARVDALSEGIDDDAFARLVALQPKLADVDRSITHAWREFDQANLQGDERVAGWVAVWGKIAQALKPLVGPGAEAADPLVRSHRAHQLAERVLYNRERDGTADPSGR